MAKVNGVILVAIAVALGGMGGGCRHARASLEPGQVVQAIIDADNARDLDAVMQHYTRDVLWMPPDGATICGEDLIRRRYRQLYDDFDVQLSATIEDVETADRLAYVCGTTTGQLISRDGRVNPVHDRFVALLRRQHGRWRVARLMWTPIESP